VRVIHLSYNLAQPPCADPDAWLKSIYFSVGIIERLAQSSEQIVLYHIRYKGIVHKNGVKYHFLGLGKRQLAFPFGLHRYIKSLNPDVVIIHGLIFAWQVLLLRLALGPGVKLLAQHHAELPRRDIRQYLQRWADRYIRAYFFTSLEHGLMWVRKKQINDAQKIRLVMEASSPFYPVAHEKARTHTHVSGEKVFLWVGRLDMNKDPITVARAFGQFTEIHPGTRLYMIYASGGEDELKNAIRGKEDRIHLRGKIDHAELLYWYNSADFIISSSYYEGSGIAVCEAMSCGCIPILTDIPSFRMMTNDGSIGLLYPPGKPEALLDKLHQSLLLDVDERKRVLAYFNETLSFEAIAKKMKSVLDQTVAS